MLYLLFAIIFGSLFAVTFRICQNLKIDCRQVILFNYVTAAIVALVPIATGLVSGKLVMEDVALKGFTWLFAPIQGVLFLAGFVIMDKCAWRGGVALTTVAARSSLILPVIFSWLFLSQPMPAWIPVIIILASMGLIVLPAENQEHKGVQLSNKTDEERRRRTELDLLGVFLCFGLSDFGVKVSQQSVAVSLAQGQSIDMHLSALMVVIFIAASLASVIWCIVVGSFKESPVGWKSIAAGVALGVVNILCTSSSLKALSLISTGLYYPLYNIGIVLFACFIGLVFFKEKIKWLQVAGIALSVLAILLFFK